MYSVVYPESKFGGFSGMVPEWLRNPILADFPEWFRNGSGMVPEAFHVPTEDILGQFDEDRIPSRFKFQYLCYSVCSAQ